MRALGKKLVVSILTHCSRRVLARYTPSIVAVTGSVGKTSTKDVIAAILGAEYRVRASQKSFNSELGVPLTILDLENAWRNPFGWAINIFRAFSRAYGARISYPEWLVLEVGADRPGDIRRITRFVKPDIAVITRIGEIPVHVEHFATPRDVAYEKAGLAHALSPDGTLIINADDDKVKIIGSAHKGTVVSYGFAEGVMLRASTPQIMYENDRPVGIACKIDYRGKSMPLRLKNVFGSHGISSALAGIAVGLVADINPIACIEALSMLMPAPGRLRLIDGEKKTLILDDSYNASPIAVLAALDTLLSMTVKGRKIAVLGDMMELGIYAPDAHREVGKKAARIVDLLYLVGTRAKFIGEGAREAGMKAEKIKTFDESAAAGRALEHELQEGDLILVKGSQYVRMERTIVEIMAEPERAPELLVRQEKEWKKR